MNGTPPAEALVLVLAALLIGVVLMEEAKGTLTSRAGALLLALATLASVAAFLHMAAR